MALKVDYKDRKEQRKFGILVGAIIILIGILRWVIHGFAFIPYLWWIIGGIVLFLGLLLPIVLQPIFFLWIKLADALNWAMTRLLLFLVFYLVIVPIGICYRLFKEDPLHRQWLSKNETYWDAVEVQPQNIEEFRRQF